MEKSPKKIEEFAFVCNNLNKPIVALISDTSANNPANYANNC
jgi:hypothetical protein